MKSLTAVLLFSLSLFSLSAQDFGGNTIDSLHHRLGGQFKNLTQKADLLNELSRAYFKEEEDESSLHYARQAEKLAEEIHYPEGQAIAVRNIGNYYYVSNDFERAIQNYKKSLEISEKADYIDGISSALGNIGAMYNELSDYSQAIKYYERSLSLYKKAGDEEGMGVSYNNIGVAYIHLSDYPNAIEVVQKAINIGEKTQDRALLVKGLNNMGFLYSLIPDYEKSLTYAQRALAIYREMGNTRGEALAMNNLGNITAQMSDYKDPKAIEYYKESLTLAEQADDRMSISMILGSIGEFYMHSGNFLQALNYSRRALNISREINDRNGMAAEYLNVSKAYLHIPDSIYMKTNQRFSDPLKVAESFADTALVINREIGNISGQRDAWELLVEIYLKNEDYKKGYLAHSHFVALKDSIQGEEVKKDIMRKEMEFEFDKKTARVQEEQERKNITQRNIRTSLLLGLVGLIFFSGLLFRQRNRLKIEKKRSENLLLNILPVEVADELKQTGKAKAKRFDHVSILFTDFVNFTQTSESLSPEMLIEELNECFTAFDHIVEKHGLEKIKTIGDAYMAVCGVPAPMDDHARRTVEAALEISEYIEERRKNEKVFEIRIGINSGSVVAGIVGVKKFAYDIWGDSVNIAARMEQSGTPGKVNISETVYELVRDDFICEYRGEIEAKNKGELKMYFVRRKGEEEAPTPIKNIV